MPSSGKQNMKRKKSSKSLPAPKKHRPNPGKITQKIRGKIKWFLRSRKNIIEEINVPSTSNNNETSAKTISKRYTTEEVSNVNTRSKRTRKNEEVNELGKTIIPISKIKEEKNLVETVKSARSEKMLGVGNNGKMKPKQKPSTSRTDVIENETTCIDGKNNEQFEEGASELKKVMEKNNTPMCKEEDTKLEIDIRIKENEKLSGEETEDEKNENDGKTGIPSIAKESSSKEDTGDDTLGFQSSITSLSVSEKIEIPLQSENKPKENIMQRSPCLGSCDEAEQHHWQIGKALRMENEEDQCCKSSGGVLAGVGLSEHAAPPLASLQEEEEWTEDHLMALLENPQYAQPPFPITLNEMDFLELERILDDYEENN